MANLEDEVIKQRLNVDERTIKKIVKRISVLVDKVKEKNVSERYCFLIYFLLFFVFVFFLYC